MLSNDASSPVNAMSLLSRLASLDEKIVEIDSSGQLQALQLEARNALSALQPHQTRAQHTGLRTSITEPTEFLASTIAQCIVQCVETRSTSRLDPIVLLPLAPVIADYLERLGQWVQGDGGRLQIFQYGYRKSSVSSRRLFILGAQFESGQDEQLRITFEPVFKKDEGRNFGGLRVSLCLRNQKGNNRRIYDKDIWAPMGERDELGPEFLEDFARESMTGLAPQHVLPLLRESLLGKIVDYRKRLDALSHAGHGPRPDAHDRHTAVSRER